MAKQAQEMDLRKKILSLAIIPLIVGIVAITLIVTQQAKELSEKTIQVFENKLLNSKKEVLRNYIKLAKNAVNHIYLDQNKPLEQAKNNAKAILNTLDFGQDGYFYVYDYQGNNIVHPRQPSRVGNNWWDLQDPNGDYVIRNLIRKAINKEGFHNYLWEKPSIKKIAEKIGYAETLDKWQWMIGTGLYIDDVREQVQLLRTEVDKRIYQTFLIVTSITLFTVLIVFITGFIINFSEKRLADTKLKTLMQRVINTQEEERGRVARELHDGISQILVSIKYALEHAKQLFHSTGALKNNTKDDTIEQTLDKALSQLYHSIGEVRRISRDLRPGLLDDLGLSPALESLTNQFSQRTGIKVDFQTVALRNLLPKDAKTALYRVAQEALTNIERHSNATNVNFHLSISDNNIILRIADNGVGFTSEKFTKTKRANLGIGLKNMQERIEHFMGTLQITSSHAGTEIFVALPKKLMTFDKFRPQYVEEMKINVTK